MTWKSRIVAAFAPALVVPVLAAQGLAQAPAQVPAPEPTPAPNPVVLKVNGAELRAVDVSMMMGSVQQEVRRSGGTISNDDLVKAATQRLIEQTLLAQEAGRRGFKPDKERIDRVFDQAVQGAGGLDKLEADLARVGTTARHLRETFEDVDVVRTMIDKDIRPKVTVTETEIEQAYKSRPDAFKLPERLHARHIVIACKPDADEATKKAARAKAEAARQRVLAGEDFATVAKEVSEDPTAKDGGDLGWVTRDMMLKEFADQVFAIEPGKISDVVESKYGYHVIKVEEKQPERAQTLDEVHDRLKQMLIAQKVADSVQGLIQQLRASATIEPVGSPEQAAAPAKNPS